MKRITLDAAGEKRAQERVPLLMQQMAGAGVRMDANETLVFSRQLEYIERQLYRVKYPQGHAIELMDIKRDIPPGAKEYTYRFGEELGQAARVANAATDYPRVDLVGGEVTIKIHTYGASFGYTRKELQQAAMADLAIDTERATTARNVIARKLDEVLWLGDSQVGITGLANNANVGTVSPVTGTWSTATAAQILADLQKLVSAAPSATKGVEEITVVALATALYEKAARSFVGDNLDKTVLDLFKRANPQIKRVVGSHRLDLADAESDGPRIVAFNDSPEVLQGIVPIEFEQLAPLAGKGGSWTIECEMSCAGTAIRYPGAVRYMDGC